jgi:alanine racemase
MTMPTTELTTSLTPGANAEAVVDLGAVAHNVRVLRELAGSAQVMTVVKADGYGHGATQVARAALAAGAAEIGVATIAEALALRRDGITAPVLAWLHPPGTDFAPALQSDVAVALSSSRQLHELLAAAKLTGVTADVTVKVDTGLSRNGAGPAEFSSMLTALRGAAADEAIRLHAIMSHLAHGDDPDNPVNDLQAGRLAEMRNRAREVGVNFEIAHLSNSPAVLSRSDLAYDLVRPGIAVYGLNPIPERGDVGLRPAMTLRCPVALVRSVRAGDGVSYGHTWIADRDTTLALLPIGYADGIFRGLSGRMNVLINGRLRPSVGRVCMDQFVVDLGADAGDVSEGDQAILFGPGADGEPTAQDWADVLDTIHYEVVTSPRGRVVRTYLGTSAEDSTGER